MRRTWAAAVAAVLLAVAAPALAETAADPCGELEPARKDLQSAAFTYSASSFSVRTEGCGPDTGPDGDWTVTVHVVGLPEPVQVTGAFQDVGNHVGWSGLRFCTGDRCGPPRAASDGALVPPGTPVDGPLDVSRTVFGHGAWVDVLPAGTDVPEQLDWWAEVATRTGPDAFAVLDRVPDTGTARSVRNASPVPARITVQPEPPLTWQPYGSQRFDTGTLTTADGVPLRGRAVRVVGAAASVPSKTSDAEGRWGNAYTVVRNTAVAASFSGDGVHEPARSATYTAGVKAWVTLDLPDTVLEVRRYSDVVLRGVVRPRGSGQVRVHVREDRAGSTWRLLRYTELQQGRYDSWYRTTWRPLVRGTWLLRTTWSGGSTAPGAVLSGGTSTRAVLVR